MAMSLRRKIATFLRLRRQTQLSLLPAWCLLGFARAALAVLTFRRLAPGMGISRGVFPFVPLLTHAQEDRAAEIGEAVRLAARYAPWKADCLPQAIAARWLLGLHDIPYALFLGVARDPATGETTAHAWVAAGRVAVSGGEGFNGHVVVGVFAAKGLWHSEAAGTP